MCQPASTVPTGHPVVAGGRLNVQWHRMFVYEAELREEADPAQTGCYIRVSGSVGNHELSGISGDDIRAV